MVFWRKKRGKGDHSAEIGELKVAIYFAIFSRNEWEHAYAWWQFAIRTAKALNNDETYLQTERIGGFVYSAFLGHHSFKFDPISGEIAIDGHPVSVRKEDRAVIHYAPENGYGRVQPTKMIVVQGEKGIQKLIRNMAEERSLSSGLHDLELDGRILRGAYYTLGVVGAWIIWSRIGLEGFFGVLGKMLSIMRSMVGA